MVPLVGRRSGWQAPGDDSAGAAEVDVDGAEGDEAEVDDRFHPIT